jgi:hypothetical protein
MTSTTSEPAARSTLQWQTRLASLKSHGLREDDSRVIECREALAYLRCRRVLHDARGQIAPDHLEALVDQLRATAVAH